MPHGRIRIIFGLGIVTRWMDDVATVICYSRWRPRRTHRRRCPPTPLRPTRTAFHLKVTLTAAAALEVAAWGASNSGLGGGIKNRSSCSNSSSSSSTIDNYPGVLRVVITTGRKAFNLLTTFTYCLIFQSTASSYRKSPTNCWVSCKKKLGREKLPKEAEVTVASSEPNPKDPKLSSLT